MSKLRQDQTTGRFVIVAPGRGGRPNGRAGREKIAPRPAFNAHCPFCPGHEALLPGIISETAGSGPAGWSVRVVPNKFPIVQPAGAPSRAMAQPDGPAEGVHELIIESPRHDADLITMRDDEVAAIVGVYRQRSQCLLARSGIRAVILFRNQGQAAGASLDHPHAQLVATSFMPPAVAERLRWSEDYHARTGRCPTCDELKTVIEQGRQLVDATSRFVAFVPIAAACPSEMWIAPRSHEPSFADGADAAGLAYLLRRCLARLADAQGRPDYNLVIDTAPADARQSPSLHWVLRIVPELSRPGGFELGAGLAVNASDPAADALLLRGIDVG